jgi:hypothetical protein
MRYLVYSRHTVDYKRSADISCVGSIPDKQEPQVVAPLPPTGDKMAIRLIINPIFVSSNFDDASLDMRS